MCIQKEKLNLLYIHTLGSENSFVLFFVENKKYYCDVGFEKDLRLSRRDFLHFPLERKKDNISV